MPTVSKRPVILNGIEELATRGDLLDRAIIIYLPAIPEDQRRTEQELDQAFELDRPRLLGTLFTALAGALGTLPTVKLDHLPRLADFATWVTAAEPELQWDSGTFKNAYDRNREESNDLTLEASPVVPALKALLSASTTTLPWEGTATDLLQALRDLVSDDVRRLRTWPATPQKLSNTLRRLAPNLRVANIRVSHLPREAGTGRRLLRLERAENSSSQPSQSSRERASPNDRRDTCDDSDATAVLYSGGREAEGFEFFEEDADAS